MGAPPSRDQGISHPLAKAKIEVELARLMCQKAAWACDAGADPGVAGEAANMAKYAAAEAALEHSTRPSRRTGKRDVVGIRAGRHVGHGPG